MVKKNKEKIINLNSPALIETLSFAKQCWLCGTNVGITEHHVIPKSMNPEYNMKIPLCRECHNKIERRRTLPIKNLSNIKNRINQLKQEINSL